ncbi:dynamin family protein [Streptomyces polygonati]|uniref:Dynamin family protein n=1 Tax=Streptomyces polygonati TaxID=1617087 RepID=A0ABV8HZ39_9ACTN
MPADWAAEAARDVEELHRLRTRGSSVLINVAMLGAFSSGKSFLLSGLQGHLELMKVDSIAGVPSDRFVGLLPSSPVPTTACPATVVPVDEGGTYDASDKGFLRVRFTDSDPDDWEDVGNSPAESVVAAYAMEDANLADRIRAHRQRKVAEIEVQLAECLLPAKLYDLPGHGSPNVIHDSIVRKAMADADCFIYVSHASRSLSENDLALIESLHNHCQPTGKRVVWVVTAIDSALQVDHRNIPAWKATINRNNAYLREHFTRRDGTPDDEFVGEGFLPVSPALEAHAVWSATHISESAAARQRAESRMDSLREVLSDLIRTETGTEHIAAVAAGARRMLTPRWRALNQRLVTERLPIDELRTLLESEQRRLTHLNAEIPRLRAALQMELDSRVKRAARPFVGLAAHLHSVMDDSIRKGDVRKASQANAIHVRRNNELLAWMRTADGPGTLWTEQIAQFKEVALRAVADSLGETGAGDQLPDYALDIREMTNRLPERTHAVELDLLQRTAAVVGVATPVAAGASWLMGLATAGAIMPPAGLIIGGAAVVYAGVRALKGPSTSLEVTQNEWIRALDAEANSLRDQFEVGAGSQGMSVIDKLIDHLHEYSKQLNGSAELLRHRIAHPEIQERRELVDLLTPICQEGELLVTAVQDLTTGA